MLLYFTFGSLKQAALIFTAIPMSAIGGIFALMLRGMPFSISAGIGFIALFGVAVLNGIVLIGTFNELEKEGETNILKRVMEGTKTRLRPVLMTATVASLGFFTYGNFNRSRGRSSETFGDRCNRGTGYSNFLDSFCLPMLYIIFSTKLKIKKPSGNKPLTAVLVLGFLFIGQTFNAQQGTPVTVEEATSIALTNNNLMRSKDLDIKVTEALKPTAKELPKMSLDAQLGQYNSKKFDQSFFYISKYSVSNIV